MTDEMLALAQRNAQEAGVANVHLPEGRDRGDPAAGGVGRRRDLELRDQPLDRQAGGADRDRPRAQAGRADRDQRRRRRGSPDARGASRARQLRRLHRRCALRRASTRPGSRRPGFEEVSVEFTHEVADGMHGAIVKARKTTEPSEGAAGDPAGDRPAAADATALAARARRRGDRHLRARLRRLRRDHGRREDARSSATSASRSRSGS